MPRPDLFDGSYRDKLISDNIAVCIRYRRKLCDWENSFIDSVDSQSYPLTLKQFNKLQDIAERLRNRVGD